MRGVLFSIILLLCGCAGTNIAKISLEEQVVLGDKFYEQKDYSAAIPYYDAVVFQRIGSNTQEISFRLADCYFQKEQFDLASLEYKQILADYPRFAKLNEVYFNLAVCYGQMALGPQYDQKERYEQIETLKKFLSLYPYDERVARAKELMKEAHFQLSLKKYHNGAIYYNISDYSSAMLYFRDVVDELDGQKVEALRKSLYYMCLIYLEWGDDKTAESYAADIDYYFPESFEAAQMKNKFAK